MLSLVRALPVVSFLACGVAAPAAKPNHAPEAETQIVQAGASVLRARAVEVEPAHIATAAFQRMIETMIRTMREAPGVGLAAPQIGIPLRVIVLEDSEKLASRLSEHERNERERAPFAVRVFVNPLIHPIGVEHTTFFEGCLSVNGYVALVERHREVEVTGLDERGKPHAWRVKGWPARILQHEVDHVDGTLYIDRMLPRSFTTAAQAKALYAGKPIAEIRKMLGL